MNILLINSPSRKGKGGFALPLGLLYVGNIIKNSGHHAKIADPYLLDLELKDLDSDNFDIIFNLIESYKPEIIGFGGIATSYGRTKKISRAVKSMFPQIYQIAGGALSSVNTLLLHNSGINLVFHGETEISLPIFLSKFENNNSIFETPGISYMQDGEIIRNSPAAQIQDLDVIPFPNYDLVDLKRYLQNVDDWLAINKPMLCNNQIYVDIVNKIGTKKNYCPIITSRGCTHRCLFCYRHMRVVIGSIV